MRHRLSVWKRFLSAGIVFSAVLALLIGSWSCRGDDPGTVESIRIGTTTSEVNSLILIAQDRGYFTRNGLNVDHRIHASGVAAVEGMLNRDVDLATGSEFAFAAKVLSGENIRTVGVINRSSVEYLVGRVDRGITHLSDLRGKRIGVPLKSRPEFSLARFLYLHGIDASEVTLVDIPVRESAEALAGGQVDAVAAWQPYVDRIRAKMGGGLVVWSSQEAQPSYSLLMCREKWTLDNPKIIARFLKALVQAAGYNAGHPEAAREMIRKKLNYTPAYMAAVWPDYNFAVSLDQALVAAMEDEARWMIENKLTATGQVPNFLSYIYEDALKGIKPEAVDIIR